METEKLQQKIIENQIFRKELAKSSFYWFFHIYFSHYVKYPTADFQNEICNILQNSKNKFSEIIAFRGSAKSTYATFAFPIWSVISENSKFIILLADTYSQTKLHIYNLKTELENNKLLIQDWGKFEGEKEWTATDIVLPKYDARITAKSRGQKVRGLRHRQYRPSLMIADDIESLESVRIQEQRNKTYQWFLGDVIPAGDEHTEFILIGNLLHKDAIMNRIREEIKNNTRDGEVKEFPFFINNEPIWKERFKTNEDIEKEKRKYDNRTWQREFLLKIIPEEGQAIKDEWIQYYDEIPEPQFQGTGIDLAISKKTTADYTAMVSGKLAVKEDGFKIYIMPNSINERLSLHETKEKAKQISLALGGGSLTPLWVEDVAYQKAAIEEMQRIGLPAESIKVSIDKRARLEMISSYVQNGSVRFPRRGCEDLIIQLTGFGIEAHDDLADAFVHCVQALVNQIAKEPSLTIY